MAVLPAMPQTVNQDWATLYAEYPEVYDSFSSFQDADEEVVRTMRDHGSLLADVELLDIGAGSGRYTRALAPLVGSVACVEPCEPLLNVAKRNQLALTRSKVEFVAAPAQHLPFEDERFDVVLAAHSLTAINARDLTRGRGLTTDEVRIRYREKDRAMRELMRVMRPSATLFSVSPSPDGYGGELSEVILGSKQEAWSAGKRTFLRWLEDEYGAVSSTIQADWVFPDVETAARIFEFVYGTDVGALIRRRRMLRVANPLVVQRVQRAQMATRFAASG